LDRPSVLFDITSSLATIFSSGHKFSVETVRRMLDLFKLAADAHKDTKRLTARIVYFSANVARKSMRCKKMVNERLTETTVKLGVRNLQKKYDVDAMALVAYFRMIPMLDYGSYLICAYYEARDNTDCSAQKIQLRVKNFYVLFPSYGASGNRFNTIL
jgi:hypothetical protein